ncbi:uncharacterized protein LOC110250212, partial [Exaiptasia diaphana]|uniref:Uncharacterized protein n=1 Tax=Exaiptasia diaphana TaxID=2652724 RepID=A0A913XZ18_EXADI
MAKKKKVKEVLVFGKRKLLARQRNPSYVKSENSSKLELDERRARQRVQETMEAANIIHKATEADSKPALNGLWSTFILKMFYKFSGSSESVTTLKENIEEEEENDLQLWDFEKGRRDPKSVETSDAIMKMVKGIHPDAPKGSIRVATRRYYTSLYEAHIKKNQFENHLARQRKYERRKRKLSARKIALKRTSQISETEKVKYGRIMMLEYMSFENRRMRSSLSNCKKIPWKSEEVNSLFNALDHKHQKKQKIEANGVK